VARLACGFSRLGGHEQYPHKSVLNKLRFCLVTGDIALSFDPAAESLSERGYRKMKQTMLEWPFTKALIIASLEFCLPIRGEYKNTQR